MYEREIKHDTASKDDDLIFVTGGSGLVGAELIRQLLNEGKRVTAIFNRTPLSLRHENLTPVKCDILDISTLGEVLKGVTKVYHCAAIVSFNKKDKYDLYNVNITGTSNVVNACLNAGVKKLLYVSSVAALGRLQNGQHITEEITWSAETNNSEYGRSKFLAEMEVWRGIGEGLQAVIVNPSLILGGDDWNRSSTEIFKTAFKEFPWFTEGVTGFVDVKDVVKAMILLMNSEITSERFILNAENLSYKKIFTEIAVCFGKKPPYKMVTPLLAELVWRLEAIKSFFTGKENLLNKETATKALAKVYFDNTKIKNTLPAFAFRPVTETISEVCKTLRYSNKLD